jgi:hypothetical protein
MSLKPWYKIIDPREDLKEGRPLDASEFAVHLDKVRTGDAPNDYTDPHRFFERTYLTSTLTKFAGEVVRRLSGEITQTNAVFNLSTQFGGGKTHALTLLYHLAQHGEKSHGWPGVLTITNEAGITTIPRANTATFVGTEFDSIRGRSDGPDSPVRKTPWGEIAWQLGGRKSYAIVAQHDHQMIAPGGDVIRAFLPTDTPCLILLDELMNYMSRSRKTGLSDQLYDFIQNLSQVAASERGIVLAVSVPASELEMTSQDAADFERIKKLLDRVGKAYIMSSDTETSEIIRRRLFDWKGVPPEAKPVISDFADWARENKDSLPSWFPVDHAYEAFEATYPFHPMVLSVFDRKWRSLPRFQQTRGVLRLLALWVSASFQGYKGGAQDPLIMLGSAPFENPLFRAAVLEQAGEERFEGVITTDISGKADSHAIRLDQESRDEIRKKKLHQKIATSIFFESNGGTESHPEASLPEIRLSCGTPDIEITNVDACLEALSPPNGVCFFLNAENNRYWFGLKSNPIKIHAEKKPFVSSQNVEKCVQDFVQSAFKEGKGGIERIFYPERSVQIPDHPTLHLIVTSPSMSLSSTETKKLIFEMMKECGTSGRTFKSSLIFAISDDSTRLTDIARSYLAWQEIHEERERLNLDDSQKKQVVEYIASTKTDLKEQVWRSYNKLGLYSQTNDVDIIDMGLINSSSSETITSFILGKLRDLSLLSYTIAPKFIVRHWPPAFKDREWSSKAVKDAFYSSPQLPRIIGPEIIKDTISAGVSNGDFAYVGLNVNGKYDLFYFKEPISSLQVELSDETFLISAYNAQKYLDNLSRKVTSIRISNNNITLTKGQKHTFTYQVLDENGDPIEGKSAFWEVAEGGTVTSNGEFTAGENIGGYHLKVSCEDVRSEAAIQIIPGDTPPPPPLPPPTQTTMQWEGEIPHLKWMNFYMKVLQKYANNGKLSVSVNFSLTKDAGLTDEEIQELKSALMDLGLNDHIDVK